MDKMRMESVDMTEKNIDKIGELFPNCITETVDEKGKLKKAINFELLKQMLSDEVIDGDEAYEFTWVGKKASIVEANKPIRKTLRPCKEESVNWDTTENLYIEGDNLEVLKLLQESYLGKVKMIYIDPPYNTGNDFIYNDDFKMSNEEYADESGEFDDDGNRMFKNTDSNGRFHSDWCSMINSRLLLARNLLSDDGVIFISIDHNEVGNLKKCCDEVFGETNRLAIISTINNLKGRSDDKFFATCNEFLIVYAKNIFDASTRGFKLDDEELEKDYDKEDEISPYKLIGFRKTGSGWERANRPFMFYPVLCKNNNFSTIPNDEFNRIYNERTNSFDDSYVEWLIKKYESLDYKVVLPTNENGEFGRWRWGRDTFNEQKDINLEFNNAGTLCTKMRATLEDGSIRMKTAKTLWYKPEYDTGTGSKVVKSLFKNSSDIFSNPKSLMYIIDILKISSSKDDIILDFFSGSATVAHATMKLNQLDNGNRKFIMVQLPEKTNEKSEAYKAGYVNICEIGKERIRRAAKKIHEDNSDARFDDGFRVLKLDDTNMNDVYYGADEYDQNLISMLESNIKSDRTDLDLLFGCLLEWGLSLSMPYSSEKIEGYTAHNYNDGDLIACFDENVPDSVIKEIAKKQPLRAVFRDSSFADSPSKINVTEIFKLMSPDTRVKVI